jgi:kumamolisin
MHRPFFVVPVLVWCVWFGGAAPAGAGIGRPIVPPEPRTIGSISPFAEKYFTVNLQPGTTAPEAARVAAYLRGFGLTARVTPESDIIFVHGTYAQAGAAAHTTFARVRVRDQVFTHALHGAGFPADVSRYVLSTTLEDGPSAGPASYAVIAPAGGYSPSDVASYYDIAPLYTAGLTGKGQTVAILACATITPDDITAFEKKFGFASNVPTIVDVDGGTTTTELEPTGDIERVIGTAPSVGVRLYVVPSACTYGELADGFAQIAADAAKIHFAAVSHSYGASEDDYAYYAGASNMSAEDADLATLLKRNDPVFAASGDWGASFGDSIYQLSAGELTVWFPASDPNVIAVGGTEAIAKSAADPVRLSELAWGVSGGGVSEDYKIPAWQKGVAGIASTTMRNVPDVALASSPGEGYAAIYTSDGTQYAYEIYGTSFAAPTWAGFLALVEQARKNAKEPALSALPKTLYSLRATSGVYGDITAGCNGYYCAGAGYDNVTGLGVFDAAKLESALVAEP